MWVTMLCHIVAVFPAFRMVSQTFWSKFKEIMISIIYIVGITVAFMEFFRTEYGSFSENFATFQYSAITFLKALMGDFDFEITASSQHDVAAPLIMGSCVAVLSCLFRCIFVFVFTAMADFSSLLSSLFTATSSSASTFFSRSSSPSSPTHSLSSPASRIGSPSSLMPRPSAASLRVRLMTSIALSSPLFEAPCRSLDRTSAAGASSRWVVDTPSSRRPCAYALDSVTASHLAHLAPTLPPPPSLSHLLPCRYASTR